MIFFKLIRAKNLFLVLLTQIPIWYILSNALTKNNIQQSLSLLELALLILCTIIIAAGGYIINDIYDVEIDRFNRYESLIIGQHFSIKQGYSFYYLSLVLGFSLALYLAFAETKWNFLLIFPVVACLLYFYAKFFKQRFLIGNIVVSLFVAAVPLIILLGESQAVSELSRVEPRVILIVIFYAFLAFVSNLMREIIKDIEDAEGDAAFGCRTLPIVLGNKFAVNLCKVLAILLLTSIGVAVYLDSRFLNLSKIIFAIAIVLAISHIFYLLNLAISKSDMSRISSGIKLLMFLSLIALIFWP